MSKIKSALELAMEKTTHIEADRGAVYRAEAVKKAKKNAALYLSGETDELVPSSIKEKDAYLESLKDTLMLNLKLPRRNEELAVLSRLEEGMRLMAPKKSAREISALFGQLKNFFAQYLDAGEQLMEALATQYEPQLRQKEALYREQTGQEINLTPQQDPEFMKLLQEQKQNMDSQYNEVVKQAKDQLTELL